MNASIFSASRIRLLLSTLILGSIIICNVANADFVRENYGLFSTKSAAVNYCTKIKGNITSVPWGCMHTTFQLYKVCPHPLYPDTYSYAHEYYFSHLDNNNVRTQYRFSYCTTGCPADYPNVSEDGVCLSEGTSAGDENRAVGEGQCKAGNPINIATGNKYQAETDFAFPGTFPFSFERYYNSATGHWRHNYQRVLRFGVDVSGQSIAEPYDESTTTPVAFAERQDGKVFKFSECGARSWCAIPGTKEELSQMGIDGDIFQLKVGQAIESYREIDGDWQLTTILHLSTGYNQTLSYQNNITTVSDNMGRSIEIRHDDTGRLIGLVVPGGHNISYTYLNDLLVRAAYPDGSTKQYHYENPSFPRALTGLSDQNGHRYATWTYDDQGRAISSEHANGVEKANLEFHEGSATTVTNELGKQTTYRFATINGMLKPTLVEGKASTNCVAANSQYSYDASGFIDTITDWQGNVTDYDYNERGLEIQRVEGKGTPHERTIITEWHPVLRLPTKVTEPHRTIEYTYTPDGSLAGKQIIPTDAQP